MAEAATDDAGLGYAHPATATARPPSTYADALGTVACVWLALITLGFAAFRFFRPALPTGASRNADRTFFTSVNAVTSTGFEQTFASVRDFPIAGKLLLAFLAVGGAAATIGGSVYFLRAIVGRAVPLRGLFVAIVACVAFPTIVGNFDAIYAATRLGLGASYDAPGTAARALLVALAVPATLGPAIWLAWRSGDRLLRSTLTLAAVLYVASTLLLAGVAGDWRGIGSVPELVNRLAENLNLGSTVAVNASTGLGLNEAWANGTRVGGGPWLVMLLMALGTVPGGLGGGIGLLPLLLLGRRAIASGCSCVAVDDRESSLLGVAIAGVFGWLATVAVAMVALAATQPAMPGDRLLFVVVSAAANVGLSHDPINLTSGGLVVLAATMLLGRLVPVAMLCGMAIVAERHRAVVTPASVA